MRRVEQPICEPSDARDRDRNSVASGQRMRVSSIPMSSRIRQLLGLVRKPFLVR